jgi:hypothetical protein
MCRLYFLIYPLQVHSRLFRGAGLSNSLPGDEFSREEPTCI